MKILSKIYHNSQASKGQSLVEVLLVFALASVLIPVLLTGFFATRGGKAQQSQRIAAIALMREGEEIARNVREKGWDYIATNGVYHPVITANAWSLSPGSETVNGFTRTITISDAYRDSSGILVASGGSVDPSTKRIEIVVSWGQPYVTSVSTSLYFTRYLNPASANQTTQVQFNNGTITNTVVTNTSGGEVTLGAGGGGDWCNPNLSFTAFDLPKSGVANAISAIEGQVFAGTGENASGVSFANVTIGNTNPPIASTSGTYDGFKTNDIYGEANYAYIATDTNTKEVDIINLAQKDSNGKYVEAGYFDAPGNGDGNSVYVVGSIGYMTSGSTLYTFNLSSKTGSRPQLGSVSLAGTGNGIVVVGNYVFVAIESSSTQLQIVQVSANGQTLSVVGQASLAAAGGKNVFVNGSTTRAYVVTGTSASQREFFIVDISTKTGNRPTVGSYDTSGMDPQNLTIVPGNRAIVVGTNGEEYQVLSIANESNPTYCGGLNIDTGVRGVSSVVESDGDAYSYIITGDASTELKIIEGGPGGQFATSGTFESTTIAASSEATFHRMQVTVNEPVQTNISLQVAIAHAINGSCNSVSFSFVGPGANPLMASSSSYFQFPNTTGNQTFSFPLPQDANGVGYENPGKCFRYKAYFSTSDPLLSPILDDLSVVYSL